MREEERQSSGERDAFNGRDIVRKKETEGD